jgi:hypothetical protein
VPAPGEISLKNLFKADLLADHRDGRRFNLISFDGAEHHLLAASPADAVAWCEAVAPYKVRCRRPHCSRENVLC